jgi:hypothetical protein
MSKKIGRKHMEKKRARQKAVKKILVEKRLVERKERKLEHMREIAFEREFDNKQKIGLSKEEVDEKLRRNIKMLEALEQQHDEEMAAKGQGGEVEAIGKQLETIEEFGRLQGELVNLHNKRAELEKNGQLDEEAKKDFELKLLDLNNKMEVLKIVKEENKI